MKLQDFVDVAGDGSTFSILERIDVGETARVLRPRAHRHLLSVSSNGSTWVKQTVSQWRNHDVAFLSVSSNGSTWVKPEYHGVEVSEPGAFSILERIDVGETCRFRPLLAAHHLFQYPRTDRRG